MVFWGKKAFMKEQYTHLRKSSCAWNKVKEPSRETGSIWFGERESELQRDSSTWNRWNRVSTFLKRGKLCRDAITVNVPATRVAWKYCDAMPIYRTETKLIPEIRKCYDLPYTCHETLDCLWLFPTSFMFILPPSSFSFKVVLPSPPSLSSDTCSSPDFVISPLYWLYSTIYAHSPPLKSPFLLSASEGTRDYILTH